MSILKDKFQKRFQTFFEEGKIPIEEFNPFKLYDCPLKVRDSFKIFIG
jgi:hypothetical protein